MILFKNTFDNSKYNLPIEDSYFAQENIGVVADGVTRDPIGVYDLNSISKAELSDRYPNPSPAKIAADIVCQVVRDNIDNITSQKLSLTNILKLANLEIKKINDKTGIHDYLQNDYYGTVAACAFINGLTLKYAYICDCGVLVYDQYGNIKFQTDDDKKKVDPYRRITGIPWNLPSARVIQRSIYRNNINEPASFGVLTGEEMALHYIKSGEFDLEPNDLVIVYTDGFFELLSLPEFYEKILLLEDDKLDLFNEYLEEKAKINQKLYGKEKTLIIMKP